MAAMKKSIHNMLVYFVSFVLFMDKLRFSALAVFIPWLQ